MKFFVTGGNGFIGSVVVRTLIEQGHAVRCLMRETSKADRIADLPFERATGDVRDYDSLVRGINGCDGVLHLASLSSWDDIHSPEMKAVVLDGTDNVLKAAAANGNKKVVFVSSTLAVNASQEPEVFNEGAQFDVDLSELAYSRYKIEAEKLCIAAVERGQPVVIVNPAEVYGPHDTGMITAKNLIDFAKSWPVLVCKGGTAVVYVEDVARGIVAAFEKGKSGERYILGGDNLTIKELADLTNDILGKKKWTLTFPNGFIKGLTKVATSVKMPLPYNPNVIPYATKYWFVDNKKAKEELGVRFRPARECLKPTLEWLKEAGHI
ncbi:MAG: NAD-dependent epimerase/dehydratase family protein [Deltaproteobacteria bacterium]|nr:NAD-dependent epimerase/dehydratase family protein [Deltaproteobacteria bacterium]